ncbi:hypothetical protein FB567DRAFT_594320 [Paraphoma chrysanthemicola]|uniref:Uncharacterized protein n=1 Tax=Paraphoma chrysanthemicola TaxID=798071 RepID=A0A8K0R4L9_9PLEO|nr:hypothetical protein FB567DRAFT_594320 [Paraphoma chrysanthemicola]
MPTRSGKNYSIAEATTPAARVGRQQSARTAPKVKGRGRPKKQSLSASTASPSASNAELIPQTERLRKRVQEKAKIGSHERDDASFGKYIQDDKNIEIFETTVQAPKAPPAKVSAVSPTPVAAPHVNTLLTRFAGHHLDPQYGSYSSMRADQMQTGIDLRDNKRNRYERSSSLPQINDGTHAASPYLHGYNTTKQLPTSVYKRHRGGSHGQDSMKPPSPRIMFTPREAVEYLSIHQPDMYPPPSFPRGHH